MPYLRLTPEMVECFGGTGSECYARFLELCVDVFLRLRRHAKLFRSLLAQLAVGADPSFAGEFTMAELDSALKERFLYVNHPPLP